MDKNKIISALLSSGSKASEYVKSEEGKKFLCGTYTDGTPRSLIDAWNDEILSPKSRDIRLKEIEKRRELYNEWLNKKSGKKKKKKKKKSKKKKNQNYNWF